MLLSSSQWHDIHGEMNVCVCVCVREGRRWRKERFRERDGADSLRIRRVSPPALMHFAVKEHACQAAKIDDGLRRMWRRQKVLFCLLMFLVSFFPPLYPSFPAWHAFAILEEECKLCCIFSFFSIPSFTFLISLSPMLLLLRSQVASRVRAGFVKAHACRRDTVTDLIAERERRAERDGDKGQTQYESPSPEIFELHLVSHIFLFSTHYVYTTHYS